MYELCNALGARHSLGSPQGDRTFHGHRFGTPGGASRVLGSGPRNPRTSISRKGVRLPHRTEGRKGAGFPAVRAGMCARRRRLRGGLGGGALEGLRAVSGRRPSGGDTEAARRGVFGSVHDSLSASSAT
jgi:hypothetical protein